MKCLRFAMVGALLLVLVPTLFLPVQAAQTKLTVMHIYPDSSAAGILFNKYVDEYQRLNPSVQIEKVLKTSTIKDTLYVLVAAGMGPDVMVMPQAYTLEYLNKGLVQPIPQSILAKADAGFLPGALQLVRWQGVRYGWPTENQPQTLIYNRQVFAQSGLQDRPPLTWDELRNMAKKMARYDPQNNLTTYGFAMNQNQTPYLSFILARSLEDGYNPIAPDLHSVAFNAAAPIGALDFLRAMMLEDRTAAVGAETRTAYQKGQVGMMWAHGPWEARDWRLAPADYAENFRSALPPVGSTGKQATTMYGYTWAVGSYSKNQAEAFKFLLWLCNDLTPEKTTRNGNMMEALGSMPNTMADAAHQPSMTEPFMQGFVEALSKNITVTMPPFPVAIPSFMEQVGKTLKGGTSAQAAMQQVDSAINVSLNDFFTRK